VTFLPEDGETGDSSAIPDDETRRVPAEAAGSVEATDADPVDDRNDSQPEKRKRSRPFWIEVPVLVLMALVIAIFIKTFLVQAFFIPSASMETTLNIDDRILVNKLAFRLDEPHRFDVVVFDSGTRRDESLPEGIRRNIAEAIGLSAPESDFIKRIIGLPGEVIEIRDNRVYVDGQAIEEPYLKPGTAMADFGPLEIAADHYFMMGDNRNQSSDSRFSGTVAHDRLVGRAFVIVWPPSNWNGL
jgi:signal peptidase I